MEGTLPRGLMGKQRGVVGRTLLGRPPQHKKSERSGKERDFESTHGAQKWVPGREGDADRHVWCTLCFEILSNFPKTTQPARDKQRRM